MAPCPALRTVPDLTFAGFPTGKAKAAMVEAVEFAIWRAY